MEYNLERFVQAQERSYADALAEIRSGRKTSHWMWYVFPQIRGLGSSAMSKMYAIQNLEEAKAYLEHPVLGARLHEITNALLDLEDRDAYAIFGSPDDHKLKSCMTLFHCADGTPGNPFEMVILEFFDGGFDAVTWGKIGWL